MSRLRYITNKIKARLCIDFWTEHEIHCGRRNADKVFYVIRRNDRSCGLFSYYIYVLGHIKYALSRNWIPIIDMQHYMNPYLDNFTAGKFNAWNYYFQQPYSGAYDLKDVYSSRHVILSSSRILLDMPNQSNEYFSDQKTQEYWRDLAHIHIPCNNAIKDIVNSEYEKLGLRGETTLGVKLRGTDYATLKPKGHAIQPNIDESLNMIDFLLAKYSCSRIYIATEDLEIYDAVVEKYGVLVVHSQAKLYPHFVDTFLGNITSNRKNDAYLRGIEYIVPMYILARCNYFFGGRNSGSVAIPIIGEEFVESVYWDSGDY